MNFREWLYNEIDWQGMWSDVKVTCADPQKIVDYLNAVRANKGVDYGKREKFPVTMPFLHASSDLFGDHEELNIEEFKRRITMPPEFVVSKNEKMEHSGGENEFEYNTGIPAFRGIVYDEERDEFKFINTCPGAGNCPLICYALDGNFIRVRAPYDRMTRVLNLMLNHPERYEDQCFHELATICARHGAYQGRTNRVVVRWNDSGDWFAEKYRLLAHSIMDRLREAGFNVKDNMYTKVAVAAQDKKFNSSTFSSGASPSETEKMRGRDDIKREITVGYKELFSDIDPYEPEGMEVLKRRIAERYGLDLDRVITYRQMMGMEEGDKMVWHVVVGRGDGDNASHRRDVATVLNLQHNPYVGSALARKRKGKKSKKSKKKKR